MHKIKTDLSVHGAVAKVSQQLQKASELGYSHAYFTDGTMPDPWAALPSYWRSQVTAVHESHNKPDGQS